MTQHIRGDTFDFSGPLNLTVAGNAQPDLTGWTPRSMIRQLDGTLVAELSATWIDAAQAMVRLRMQDTSAWPIGKARIDIQLTSPTGDVVSTRASLIEIVGDVTFDG